MAESPQPLVLRIDLDTIHDSDGSSIRHQIIEAAARALLREDKTISEAAREYEVRVRAIADEEIRVRLGPLIEVALEEGVQQTDEWGSPRGAKKPLRDLIVEIATREMAVSKSSSSRRRTVFEEVIEDQVERQLRGDLQKVVEAARKEVLAAVREQAATVITETIARVTLPRA